MVGSKIFLRILKEEGVTSNSSSVSMNSSACSRLRTLGGVRRSASSALERKLPRALRSLNPISDQRLH